MFGGGFYFANQIQSGMHQFQRLALITIALLLGSWLLHRFIKARQRSGQPIGPPVQIEDELFPPVIAEAVKASKLLEDEHSQGFETKLGPQEGTTGAPIAGIEEVGPSTISIKHLPPQPSSGHVEDVDTRPENSSGKRREKRVDRLSGS